jgi:hypothetical protein
VLLVSTITPDERRALEIIIAEPTGCPEHLLIAQGFTIEFLAGLVRNGLANVTAVHIGTSVVFYLSSTKRGQHVAQTAPRQGF